MKVQKFMFNNLIDLPLDGLKLIETVVFKDNRGFFMESWNEADFRRMLGEVHFVQDNQSESKQNVIRGLHYQVGAHPQAKLIRCISGKIFDVVVDIRRSSPTFGHWYGLELSSENRLQLFVPVGFAHGFLTMSKSAEVLYKVTDFWHKECEGSIRWNDPTIAIKWPLKEPPCLSEKDKSAPYLEDAIVFE